MKRFHVHVAVEDIEQNVRFYSTVFGAPPTVLKPDYAKWMLEDPRVNFDVIDFRAEGDRRLLRRRGLHLRVQRDDEVHQLEARIRALEVKALRDFAIRLVDRIRQFVRVEFGNGVEGRHEEGRRRARGVGYISVARESRLRKKIAVESKFPSGPR